MRPLRILIILTYYLPHRTGLTLHAQRIGEELVRRGHQVTVLSARFNPDLPERETINGVHVVRLWAPIRVSRGMLMPSYPWHVMRQIREHDVVSINTPMLESALTALIANWFNKPLVITHHGDLILPKGAANRVIQAVVFGMYKLAARSATRLVGYSHDYADHSYYLAGYEAKTSIIYPPILMPAPQPAEVARLRAAWGVTNGYAIGFAGRFVEEKRPDVLIRALETVNQRLPGAKVVFAGEYEIKYEHFYERTLPLVDQYKDQLIFLGLLRSEQEMANFYAACDVLALPSDTECLGFVQVEAMLCGTPVVVTDTPGAREAVTVTGMGKVVGMGNPEGLGEALVEVMTHRETYVKPRAEIERAYSFPETVDRYEAVYRRAVELRARREPPER